MGNSPSQSELEFHTPQSNEGPLPNMSPVRPASQEYTSNHNTFLKQNETSQRNVGKPLADASGVSNPLSERGTVGNPANAFTKGGPRSAGNCNLPMFPNVTNTAPSISIPSNEDGHDIGYEIKDEQDVLSYCDSLNLDLTFQNLSLQLSDRDQTQVNEESSKVEIPASKCLEEPRVDIEDKKALNLNHEVLLANPSEEPLTKKTDSRDNVASSLPKTSENCPNYSEVKETLNLNSILNDNDLSKCFEEPCADIDGNKDLNHEVLLAASLKESLTKKTDSRDNVASLQLNTSENCSNYSEQKETLHLNSILNDKTNPHQNETEKTPTIKAVKNDVLPPQSDIDISPTKPCDFSPLKVVEDETEKRKAESIKIPITSTPPLPFLKDSNDNISIPPKPCINQQKQESSSSSISIARPPFLPPEGDIPTLQIDQPQVLHGGSSTGNDETKADKSLPLPDIQRDPIATNENANPPDNHNRTAMPISVRTTLEKIPSDKESLLFTQICLNDSSTDTKTMPMPMPIRTPDTQSQSQTLSPAKGSLNPPLLESESLDEFEALESETRLAEAAKAKAEILPYGGRTQEHQQEGCRTPTPLPSPAPAPAPVVEVFAPPKKEHVFITKKVTFPETLEEKRKEEGRKPILKNRQKMNFFSDKKGRTRSSSEEETTARGPNPFTGSTPLVNKNLNPNDTPCSPLDTTFVVGPDELNDISSISPESPGSSEEEKVSRGSTPEPFGPHVPRSRGVRVLEEVLIRLDMSPSLTDSIMENGSDSGASGANYSSNDHIEMEAEEAPELDKSLTPDKLDKSSYEKIIKEYEKTLAAYVQQIEYHKQQEEKSNQEKLALIGERDQAIDDLNNVESAFADLHRKYERSKETMQNLKENENRLVAQNEDLTSRINNRDKRLEMYKDAADDKMRMMHRDYESKCGTIESENTRLQAQLKLMKMKLQTMQNDVEQKAVENAQLNALCNELINGKH